MAGIDKEIQRIRAGLRALGERVEAERQAGTMTDAQLAELSATMRLMQRDLSAIKEEDLPRLQRSVDKINGRVEGHGALLGEHTTEIQLLKAFCNDQVRPNLKVIQDNRLEIAKRAALYGLMGVLGAAVMTGIIQLLIAVL